MVEGKSSLARIGLGVHITAPIIHPGFGCPEAQPIMLEFVNHSKNIIVLRPGTDICQFIFYKISDTPSLSSGSKTYAIKNSA